MTLTLEEFAARTLWLEHMRLSEFISEPEAYKHFRKTLARIVCGDFGISANNEWSQMVKAWYAKYLSDGKPQPDSAEYWREIAQRLSAQLFKARRSLECIEQECRLHAEGPHDKTGNMFTIRLWAAKALEATNDVLP